MSDACQSFEVAMTAKIEPEGESAVDSLDRVNFAGQVKVVSGDTEQEAMLSFVGI